MGFCREHHKILPTNWRESAAAAERKPCNGPAEYVWAGVPLAIGASPARYWRRVFCFDLKKAMPLMLNALLQKALAVIFLIVGISFIHDCVTELRLAHALASHGIFAKANASNIHWSTNKHGRDVRFKATMNFPLPDGRFGQAEEVPVPDTIGADLRDGRLSVVDIKYLPDNPEQAQYLGYSGSNIGTDILAGVLFVVAGLALFFKDRLNKLAG